MRPTGGVLLYRLVGHTSGDPRAGGIYRDLIDRVGARLGYGIKEKTIFPNEKDNQKRLE